MSKFKAYYCNQYLTDELNNRLNVRTRGTESLEPFFEARSVSTRLETMPMYDCRKKSNIPLVKYPTYNQHKQFNPGYRGPYNGYSSNVDIESRLFNKFRVLQKGCDQMRHIPGSASDLYVNRHFIPDDNLTYLTQQQENFMSFNPNQCNIAKELFNNHTRQQTKNIDTKEVKKPTSKIRKTSVN
jgi:hypothetical protein